LPFILFIFQADGNKFEQQLSKHAVPGFSMEKYHLEE